MKVKTDSRKEKKITKKVAEKKKIITESFGSSIGQVSYPLGIPSYSHLLDDSDFMVSVHTSMLSISVPHGLVKDIRNYLNFTLRDLPC